MTSIGKTENMKEFNKATYGSVIKQARLKKGLNQPELAKQLGLYKNFVSNWELGIARPDLNIIPRLCEVLGISTGEFFRVTGSLDLTKAEEEHIKKFRRLAERERASIDGFLDVFLRQAEDERIERCRKNFYLKMRSWNAAAAGIQGPLGDEDCESIYIRKTPESERADLITPVSGDSMEPTFRDGDDVMIEYTDSLSPGEIGIFFVNGEGFIKEYRKEGLYSHNSGKYPLRTFCQDDEVRCVGRVLGKVTRDMYPDEEEAAILNGGEVR